MQRLLNLAEEDIIEIYIPDIVVREDLIQLGKEDADETKRIDRYIDKAIRNKLFPDINRKDLQK